MLTRPSLTRPQAGVLDFLRGGLKGNDQKKVYTGTENSESQKKLQIGAQTWQNPPPSIDSQIVTFKTLASFTPTAYELTHTKMCRIMQRRRLSGKP